MKHHLVIVAAVMLAVAPARGQDRVSEAREHFEKGLSAFALGHYSDAADEYEKAFELKADPALLYNAAQAHRHAGHYERALELYKSYQRLFGKKVKNGPKVQQHIDELTKLVAAQAKEKDRPPADVIAPGQPAQSESASVTTPSSAPEPATTTTSGAVKPQPNDARPDLVQVHKDRKPLVKRPWLWIGVGGAAVAVGLGVGLGVGLSRAPSPSFGATTVQ